MDTNPDSLIAAHELEFSRTELHHDNEGWHALYLRHAIDGGWVIRERIDIPDIKEQDT